MKTLEKVSDFVGKYMAAIVIVVAAGALFFPGPFSVVKTAWVNNLLGIVMFGMGLTLKPEDFKVVFSRPKDVIVGCVAQFTLMPFLAWALQRDDLPFQGRRCTVRWHDRCFHRAGSAPHSAAHPAVRWPAC